MSDYDHPAMIDWDWDDLCRREERGEFDDVIYGEEPDGTPRSPSDARRPD